MSDKTEKIYRLGLLGCGRFGKNYVKTIAAMDNVELVHVFTSNKENHKLFSKKVRFSETYQEVCQNKTLDGVIIATPPDTHYEIMKECLYNLVPFVVEKPMCLSLKDSISIQEAVKHVRLPALVGHTQLFNPAFEHIISVMKYQKVHTIVSDVSSFGPFRKDVSMIWDWLPHDLSMCLATLRELPQKVKASYDQHANYDNSGRIGVELMFKNCMAYISINNLGTQKYRAFVAKGNFNTMTMFGNEAYEVNEKSIRPITVSNETPLQILIESFITTIETQTYHGIDMGVDIARIIESVVKSIENKSEYIMVE